MKQTEVYSVFFLGDIVQFVNEKIDFYEIDFDYMTHLYKHDNGSVAKFKNQIQGL